MKILFTTMPSNDLGLLARSLPVAQELAAKGHAVAFSSPGATPRIVIAEAGFTNVGLEHPISARPTERPITGQFWNVDHMHAYFGFMDEGFVQAGVERMLSIMTEYKPDVVVDSWNLLACIAAKVLGIRLVTLMQADEHPLSRGFIWWKKPTSPTPSPVASINKVLTRYRLRAIETTGELLLGDLPLVLGMPETDPLPEGAHVTYIGAILWQNPKAILPAWVDELDAGKPVIWVYTGNPRYSSVGPSPADSEIVPQAAIEALRDMDVSVVLTTGHQELPKELPPFRRMFATSPSFRV